MNAGLFNVLHHPCNDAFLSIAQRVDIDFDSLLEEFVDQD
jgi:hypothetical protein